MQTTADDDIRTTTDTTRTNVDAILGEKAFEDDHADDMIVDVADEEEADEPAPELTFEQKCAKLETAIIRQSLHREIHYKTLVFCQTRRMLRDVEQEIMSYPEFKHATQDPFHLAQALVTAGGLDYIELDEDGNVVTEEMKEGLTEDEIDDLVYDFAFETTDVGREMVVRHDPHARLAELLDLVPGRYDAYIEVLETLGGDTPCTYKQIEDLLQNSDALMAGRQPGDAPVQPSVFLDKLERAGSIVWDDGWTLTEGGRDFLEELKTSSSK